MARSSVTRVAGTVHAPAEARQFAGDFLVAALTKTCGVLDLSGRAGPIRAGKQVWATLRAN